MKSRIKISISTTSLKEKGTDERKQWPRAPQRPFQSFVATDEWSANEVRIESLHIATWRDWRQVWTWLLVLQLCRAGVIVRKKWIDDADETDAGQTILSTMLLVPGEIWAPRTALSSFCLLWHALYYEQKQFNIPERLRTSTPIT